MSVNYEYEVWCFYDWLETNEMGTSCIVLWHALMHTYRKAGYPVLFAVAKSVLETKTGLSESSIKRARNTLKQLGLIDWLERKGNQSVLYKINCFAGHSEPQNVPQSVPQSVPINNNNKDNNINIKDVVVINNGGHSEPQSEPQSVPQPINAAQNYFEKTCGLMSLTAYQELVEFMSTGIELGLIQAAIDRAIDNGVYKWAYIKKILEDCVMSNITTLNQFLVKEQNYRITKGGGSNGQHGGDTSNTSSNQKSAGYAGSDTKTANNSEYGGETEGARLNKIIEQYRGKVEDIDCDY